MHTTNDSVEKVHMEVARAYRTMRESIGSQEEVAWLLGVRQATLSDRETGNVAVGRESQLAILYLAQQCPAI